MNDWRELIPADDRRLYEAGGFGSGQRLGERPALLVIDVTRGFTGSPGQSREEAVREYRTACGPPAWASIPHIAKLIDGAREAGVEVIYTRGRSMTGVRELGRWASKNARAREDLERGEEIHRIVDEVAPRPGERVIEKEKPSAFFGTPLLSHLIAAGTDSLIVAGCTTSGCVRASVIDAFSYNYPVSVVEEAVFDRGELSHAVNLFDMQAKYAQVARVDEVLAGL